jgi:hypothetical protein
MHSYCSLPRLSTLITNLPPRPNLTRWITNLPSLKTVLLDDATSTIRSLILARNPDTNEATIWPLFRSNEHQEPLMIVIFSYDGSSNTIMLLPALSTEVFTETSNQLPTLAGLGEAVRLQNIAARHINALEVMLLNLADITPLRIAIGVVSPYFPDVDRLVLYVLELDMKNVSRPGCISFPSYP